MGVKILCLNVLRTFKQKKVQLLAITIIIFLSSFLYTTMFYTLDSLTQGMQMVIQTSNQEDFSIDMIDAVLFNEAKKYMQYRLVDLQKINLELYQTIIRKRQNSFLKKYPEYELETRYYKDVDFDDSGKGHKIRFYKDAEKINQTYIEKGRKPRSKSEIALNRVYAEKNNISLGEKITIKGKPYTLVGWIIFPDMTFPIMGSDFIIDTEKIATGLVVDQAYREVKGKETIYFAGKAKEKEDLVNFKDQVIGDIKNHETLKFITNIVLTENQMRSGAIYEELKTGKIMTLGISMIISSLAVMIVAILVTKILKNEKVQIGVLKALGYSRTEIALPYIFLLLVIGLPSLVMGYLGGLIAADPLKRFYLEFYLLPNEPIRISMEGAGVAIGVPLIIILGLSFYIIIRLLSKDVIKLLKVDNMEKVTRLNKWINYLLIGARAKTKFKYSFIFKNMGKFIVFFWGISLSSILILLSLMMVGFFDKMALESYESTMYNYEGHIDPAKKKPKIKASQEKFLVAPNSFYKNKSVTSKGIQKANALHKLYDYKSRDITALLADGVIVNKSFAITYDVKPQDKIVIEIGDKMFEKAIVAVSKDYGDPIIYWELEELSKAVSQNKSKKLYTGIYSETPLDEDQYAVVINKKDIMEQASLMQGFIQISIYSMMGCAAFISILILYVLTSMTVEDNYYNISLLKVMGYSQKEVNDMILNSYLVYGVLSYFLILPGIAAGVGWMVDYFGKSFGVVMPLEFEAWHGLAGVFLIISIFSIGSYSAKKRIEKVALQEILKAYRE